jgi:hypothetical protein
MANKEVGDSMENPIISIVGLKSLTYFQQVAESCFDHMHHAVVDTIYRSLPSLC